ncbi:MAG TPA: M1 family aminopeptidase [Chitinophagaceae bacterium]|nr:M1 family aminopeptidase [Chitinophagaceae bacterium]
MRRWIFLVFIICSLIQHKVAAQFQVFEKEIARYQAMTGSSIAGSNASPDFKVDHYRFEWEIDPAVRYIKGKVSSSITITANTSSIRFDLTDSLRVDSVLYHANKISFTRPGNHLLQINFPAALNTGARDSVSIYYQGAPPASGLGAFSVSNHTGVPIIWTLSEPYGSREWWPCRNGLDDKADSIDIFITTPDQYFATTNGIQMANLVNAGKRTTVWKHRYPIASYLVAMAATNYQVQEDTIELNGKILPLQQYVYPEAAAAWAATVPDTRRMMRVFEQYFGPYPFRNERYAHTQVGFGGGMEHQTNSFMGSTNASLIAHELGHQWFGDRVTCGSWQDIWLNEGFATFLTYFYFEGVLSEQNRIAWYRSEVDYIAEEPGGSVYVKDTSSVGSIFNYRTTYVKAGWLLQMLRWKLGDAAFFEGLRNYLADPSTSYEYARTEDLKRNLEASSGQNLTAFFNNWLYAEGYPSYQLSWLPLGNKVQLTLSQTTSHPSVSFYEMPVPVLFKNATRDTLIVINHTKNAQTEIRDLGFIPDTAFIDPYVKLISFNNKTSKAGTTNKKNDVTTYPNPVGDQFNILLRNFSSDKAGITIHNAAGQLIWKQELSLPTGSDLLSIPSSTWSRGIYILSVNSKDSKFVKRIMK